MQLTIRTLVICASFAAAVPAAAAGSAEFPVPGGTRAMARALGIDTAPERPRFLTEIVRAVYDPSEGKAAETETKLARLASYVDAVDRLQPALAAFPGAASGVALASGAENPAGLKPLLDALGLRLREKNKVMRVEPAEGKAAADRVRQLTAIGIDVTKLVSDLNAGISVRVAFGSDTVPVPLPIAVWSGLLQRPVTASSLFTAIVSDRRAALLAYGLAALDDETVAYLGDNPAILARLYQESAAPFAAFGEALRIRGGRVVPPGGAQGVAVWEAVLNEKAASPDRFVRAVFETSQGRVALVYSALAHLDAPHARFALGSWMPDAEARIAQFKTLLDTAAARAEWIVNLRPFTRPTHDVTLMLARVRVQLTGAPAAPASRLFWRRVFEGDNIPDDAATGLRAVNEEGVVDAGWLAANVCVTDPRVRADRLNQVSFAQRVFGGVHEAQLADTLVAVRSLPRYHMLMLTLERMQIREPRIYAAAAVHARKLASLDGRRAFVALGQFQSALALTTRLVQVRSLLPAAAEPLVAALIAVPVADDGTYRGAIARWIDGALAPALKWNADGDVDAELTHAVAGAASTAGAAAKVTWEGRPYRVDLVAAEEQRLMRVREKMDAPSLTAALQIARAADKLAAPATTVAVVRAAGATLRSAAASLPKYDKKSALPAPGVEPPKNAGELLSRTLVELSRIARDNDVPRAAAAGQALSAMSDDLLAQALMSWAYALDIGNPDGTTLLGGDPSRRHDFGFETRNSETRIHAAWAEPREITGTGAPRHVEGSVLGLSAGLAERVLRRIDADELPSPPTLMAPERETFVKTVGLMNPFEFTDAGRDAILAALARGRSRLASLTAADWDAAADQLRLDGWRRRQGRWAIANEPAMLPSLLSLFEIVALGEPPADAPLDLWGMSGLSIDGCLCTARPPTASLPILAGRPQLGLLAATAADITLRVADRLASAQLPAALLRGVLAGAVLDFVEQVRPLYAGDWLTFVRTAQAITDDRIDDYIAALTADGPLVGDRTATAGGQYW